MISCDFSMVGSCVFFFNFVCEVQNEEDETLLDPYMIPKDFGIFEVIESSDSTTDAWIFTNPVELDGTFHFEREVSSRVGTIVACNFCEMLVRILSEKANVLKMCCYFDGSFCLMFSLKLRKRVMHTALANP